MVAFIGIKLRGELSGENFDQSIASCQICQTIPKVLHYTIYLLHASTPSRQENFMDNLIILLNQQNFFV